MHRTRASILVLAKVGIPRSTMSAILIGRLGRLLRLKFEPAKRCPKLCLFNVVQMHEEAATSAHLPSVPKLTALAYQEYLDKPNRECGRTMQESKAERLLYQLKASRKVGTFPGNRMWYLRL